MADEPTIAMLVADALQDDPDASWEAISLLHRSGTREVLDAAVRLADSPGVRERVCAADILGQLGVPERTFPDESLMLLMGLLTPADDDEEVISAAAAALGHLHPSLQPAQRAVIAAALSELSTHDNEDVRFAVVHGLSGLDEPQAVATLILLSDDDDPDVRNWATFGIGSLTSMDTDSVRDALAARLHDDFEEVRGEAMVGLARRQDERVRAPLTEALGAGGSVLAVRAAGALRDRSLAPLLETVRDTASDELVRAAAEGALAALNDAG
jgi:HEAT repeat protein